MRIVALLTLLAAAPQDPESFEALHGRVKPQPGEWNWARIPWMSDLAAARRKAAAEDKPLYVWTMAGEPLGQC
jgi:hypothetical protein